MNALSFLIAIVLVHFATAQFTIFNNCKDTVKVYSDVLVGDNPLSDGKDFPAGHNEQVSVNQGRWFGYFYGNALQTLATFGLDLYNGTDTYFGSVFEGFNIPLSITPSNQGCPVVHCLGKPSDECANTDQDFSKTHHCQLDTNYTITFCPNPVSTVGIFTPETSPELFLNRV